jgi:hypothetical protein
MPMVIDPKENFSTENPVKALALSPDGNWLAWGDDDGNVTIRGLSNSETPDPFVVEGGVGHLAISAQGILVVGSHSGDLHGHERLGGHRWSHHLGGGCDHLAVATKGDLVAVIDGARLLHLLTSGGNLLCHHSGGELMMLAVADNGEVAAVADDEGNVTVVARSGAIRYTRPSRGEQGERITALTFISDGHLVIARESLDVTLGDEEEIVIEWWNPLGDEVDRIPLVQRCEVLQATETGVLAGMFDGEVVEYNSSREGKTRFKSSFSIHDLLCVGQNMVVASWFEVHLIDAGGDEVWQVQHAGLTELVRANADGTLLAVAGDNQNEYTRENEVLLLEVGATPYMMESGRDIDSDLTDFEETPLLDTGMVTDSSAYDVDNTAEMEGLLTDAEMAQLEGGATSSSGSSELLDLLEAEVTLTDDSSEDQFDIVAGLLDESGRTNLPPVADAGEDQIVQADGEGNAVVMLDGSRSYDEDGEIESHVWTDEGNRILGEAPQIKVKLPKGNYTFTLTVTDNDRASTSDAITVQVR